jgi:hypothetical protein
MAGWLDAFQAFMTCIFLLDTSRINKPSSLLDILGTADASLIGAVERQINKLKENRRGNTTKSVIWRSS